MADYWDQLLNRVNGLREMYAAKKIPLKAGEGLAVALDEAEATAKRVKSPYAPTSDNFLKTACACHAIWNLYDVVTTCAGGGLDVTNHLRQLEGVVDFSPAWR